MDNKLSMYCKRCNKHHSNIPVDRDKLVKKHASDMANLIDNQVIKELKHITEGASSMRDLKKGNMQGRGVLECNRDK